MLFKDYARILSPDKLVNRVVYDLDALLVGGSNDTKLLKRESVAKPMIKKSRSVPKLSGLKRGNSSSRFVFSCK